MKIGSWNVSFYNAAGDQLGISGFASTYINALDQATQCFKAIPVLDHAIMHRLDQVGSVQLAHGQIGPDGEIASWVPKIRVNRCSCGSNDLHYTDLDPDDVLATDDKELERTRRTAIGKLSHSTCTLYALATGVGTLIVSKPHKHGVAGVCKLGVYTDCTADEALHQAAATLDGGLRLVASRQ